MISRESEPSTDQAVAFRLAPSGDIPCLARVQAWGTVRTEFVQEAWRLASNVVIGVIIARRNQSRAPKSRCSLRNPIQRAASSTWSDVTSKRTLSGKGAAALWRPRRRIVRGVEPPSLALQRGAVDALGEAFEIR